MPISESCTAGELQQINAALYQDVMPENYETSYCNYEYTRQMFGEKIAENEIEDIDKREYLFADYLTFLCYEFHGLIAAAFEGRVVDLTVWFELFVEVYGIFENFPSVKAVKDAIYYFEHDYAEFFMDYRVREKMDPILSFATDIVMNVKTEITAIYMNMANTSERMNWKRKRFFAGCHQKKWRRLPGLIQKGFDRAL